MDAAKIDRIRASIARAPHLTDSRVAKNLRHVSAAEVAHVRAMASDTGEAKISGVSLGNRRVLSRRPAESAAKFIKRLPNGRGFHPRDLAQSWGMSEETIRRHARDLGCLKFVEVSEDEWHPLIMSPDTAAKYDL
jgi:hypothetical protein